MLNAETRGWAWVQLEELAGGAVEVPTCTFLDALNAAQEMPATARLLWVPEVVAFPRPSIAMARPLDAWRGYNGLEIQSVLAALKVTP